VQTHLGGILRAPKTTLSVANLILATGIGNEARVRASVPAYTDTARGPPGWTVFTKIPTPFGPGWNLPCTYSYPSGQGKPYNGNEQQAHTHTHTHTHTYTHTHVRGVKPSSKHNARSKEILTIHRCQRTGPVEQGWRRKAFRQVWSFARWGWVAGMQER